MFQKTRFVRLRSWLCVVRHQRLKNDFKLNNQLRNDINKKKFWVAVGIWSSRMLLPLETLWWARVPWNNQWWTRFIQYTKFAIFLYTYTEMKLWIELVFPSVWRSVENDRPTPTWPGFLPTSLPGLWFCYWFSPCSEGFSLDSLVLPPSTKKQHLQIPNRSG